MQFDHLFSRVDAHEKSSTLRIGDIEKSIS